MLRPLITLLAIVGFSNATFSQVQSETEFQFHQDGFWMNVDSALSLNRLTSRNPLLLVEFNPNDPSLIDLSNELNELGSHYPFLNIIGVMICDEPYQFQPQAIQRTCRRSNWESPLFTQMMDTSSSRRSKMNYGFFDIREQKPTQSGPITALDDFVEKVKDWMSKQVNVHTIPHSYQARPESGLVDLQLLSNPSGLAVDEEYEYLIIADTDHHRIILCDTDGRIIETIGTGKKGHMDGPSDEVLFSSPSGLAYDETKRRVYVADRGNEKIRVLDLDSRVVSTLTLMDEDERHFKLTSPISRLHYHSGNLILSSAGAHCFWKVDLTTMQTSRLFGSLEAGKKSSKSPLKTQLLSASDYTHLDNLGYFLDEKAGNLYNGDAYRSDLILSEDSALAGSKGAIYSPDVHGLKAITVHEDRIVGWNPKQSNLVEINPFSFTLSPLLLDSGQVLPESVSDMVSVGENLYILDPEKSMVFKVTGSKVDRILFKERSRALHIVNPADLFLPIDPIELSPSEQTILDLIPIIPPHYSLDPSTSSSIYISGGKSTGVVLEGKLDRRNLKLILFPDMQSNQVNLNVELNFCEKEDPWSCYQRWVTINIPVIREGEANSTTSIDLELFKGL